MTTRSAEAGETFAHQKTGLTAWLLLALLLFIVSSAGALLRPAYSDAMAVPRGAGVTFAFLLIFGLRRWPLVLGTVLAGRLLAPIIHTGALHQAELFAALANTALTLLQAVAGVTLLRRFFGMPINLKGPWDIAKALLLIGPILCLPAATIGMALESGLGLVPRSGLLGNWIVWAVGAILGNYMAVPLALLLPAKEPAFLRWKGVPLPRFQLVSFVYVLFSLAATATSWAVVNSITLDFNQGRFETLVRDNRHALRTRLAAYAFGLQGARGFLQSSLEVSQPEWSNYVDVLQLGHQLPGLAGVGFVSALPQGSTPTPAAPVNDSVLVQFVDQLGPDMQTLGQEIAADPKRFEAALHARDSGSISLGGQIELNYEGNTVPGFLLFDPVYAAGAPMATVTERRAAFRGWVYAPVLANRLLANLTANQRSYLTISASYVGANGTHHLIYDDRTTSDRERVPSYGYRDMLPVFGQDWSLEWRSTPEFENAVDRSAGAITMVGGLAFSTLLALYLLSLARREDRISAQVADRTKELAARIEENRSIVQTPNANIALMDQNGHLLFANDSLIRLFGYPGADLLGRELAWLLDGATAEYFAWAKRRPEPTSYRSEVRTKDSKGEQVVLDVQISAWLTAKGERRYTALMTNITDKLRVEEELRRTQHRLDVALSGAKIGVFEVDLATNTSIVSSTWKQIYGFDPDAEIDAQAEFLSRLHPDDRPFVEAADRACIMGEVEKTMSEFRVRLADDSWHWMRTEAVAGARDENGIATRLIGAQTDITELIESKEALRNSEEQLRSAIEAAPIGTAIIALDGRFIKLNKALSALVGLPMETVLDFPFHRFLHPDDRPRLRGIVEAMLQGTRDVHESEIRCLNAMGQDVWGRLSLALVRDSEGRAHNFVIQVQDITEQRKIDRIKNEFIATVSHELRTPLTSINGSLGLVLNGVAGEMPEKAQKMLSIAHKNTSRLILLVNDILDMEKLSSGKMKFSFAETDVVGLVQQAMVDNKPYAQQMGVKMVLQDSEEEFPCMVDANRFQQVMANLMSNAVKFSPTEGKVEVRAERQENMVRISVTDHGKGVPVEFQPKIFTAFSQADSSSTRKQAGTGLGLSISRQIVEQMGGAIGFDSTPDVETTFWFTLPLSAKAELEGAAASAPVQAAGNRPRILHVEADADFAEIVAASFGQQADLVHVRTRADAMVQLAAGKIDLLLLDEVGQSGDSRRVIELAMTRNSTMPVVLLTANDLNWTDARVRRTFIKTRTSMQAIVSTCLACIRQSADSAHHAAE